VRDLLPERALTSADALQHSQHIFQKQPAKISLTFSSAVDNFIRYSDLMPRTKRVYSLSLNRCARDLGAMRPVESVTGAELAQWHKQTFETNAPKTWNRERSTLQSLVRWMNEQGFSTIELPPIKRRKVRATDRTKALTREEVERILTMKASLRDRTFWTMLYETAARASEILALDMADLDIANRRARVTRKGGEVQWVGWSTRTATLLPRLLKGRTAGPLFLTLRRACHEAALLDLAPDGRVRLTYRQAERCFKDATGATWHQLRHSALTHLAEDGMNSPMLMLKSGHKSIATLAIYARPSFESLQRWEQQHDPARRR